MYGVGDRVSVLCYAGKYFVVSVMDIPSRTNTGRLALIHDYALLEVLNGLCLTVNYNYQAYSYADFYNVQMGTTTRIDGVPDKDKTRFLDRLLKACLQGARNEVCKVKYNAYQESFGGGPPPVPVQKIHGLRLYGNTINHIPSVIFEPFSKTDNTGDLSVYSYTQENLKERFLHPSEGAYIFRNHTNQTVIWFNDENPEYVLVIAVCPVWDVNANVTQYIQFLEVPVYGFCERKQNNADVDAEVCWQRFEDQIRLVHYIPRDWIDWSIFDNS
jgi:hypothetical protein